MKPVTKSKISAFVVVLLLFGCSLYWVIRGVIVLNHSFSEKNLIEITPSNAKKDYEKYNDLCNPGENNKNSLKCEGILREYDSRLRSNLDIDSLLKNQGQTSSNGMFVPYYIDTTAKSYAVIKIV